MIAMQASSSASVMTSGGAKRMILPCVGFANNPLSLRATHKSHAVELSGVSLMITALISAAAAAAAAAGYHETTSLIDNDEINKLILHPL